MDGLVEILGVTLVLRLEIRPLVDLKERKSCSLASIHYAVLCVCVCVCVCVCWQACSSRFIHEY